MVSKSTPHFPALQSSHEFSQRPPKSNSLAINSPRLRSGHQLFQRPAPKSNFLAINFLAIIRLYVADGIRMV